jgi:hypothetical protein
MLRLALSMAALERTTNSVTMAVIRQRQDMGSPPSYKGHDNKAQWKREQRIGKYK